jgi:CRISPR-associated protein Csa1
MRVFYTYDDVLRLNAMLSSLPSEVSEELRGWNWSKYPLLAPSRTQVAVSEVLGGFCESLRFVYVKKVLKEPQASVPKLEEGLLIHRTFGEAISTVKALVLKLGLRNYREFRSAFMAMLPEKEGSLSNDLRLVTQERARQIVQSLWEDAANIYSAAYSRVASASYSLSPDGLVSLVVPLVSEFPLDGSLLGFSSNIRADALLPPNILVEIKTRRPRHQHELQLTAYALAFESVYRVPVNYSLIVYIDVDEKGRLKRSEKVVMLSDQLRSEVIEKRDMALKIVDEGFDPGLPERCDRFCPYLRVCGVDEDRVS